jgi:Zn-dependent M16 (insulinase) family peptidase
VNVKDYYNLMSVYLDAVFFPKLDYHDFLQEGHRLEVDEETNKLQHMGVVYNEMKGAMSDASDLFSTEMHRALYPTTTYHFNSGGDPKSIRDITHEDVLAFHKEFYHPSNSYTMTYGDLALQPHLDFIDKNVLHRFDRIKPNSNVQDEKRLTEPQRIAVKGPLSTLADANKQTKVSVSWLTGKITESYEVFCMSILSHLLTAGPTSPFYKALISSNIGLTYSPGTGFDNSVRETSFSVGLSDILEEDVDKVERLIYETLDEVVLTGFPKERIEAVIHQIEYGQKHISTGFGLNLVSGLSHAWLHGSNVAENIAINEHLERLKKDLESGPFLQDLVKRNLISNPHRVTFIMTPDAEYSAREQAEEESSLKKLEETTYASEESRNGLIDEAEELEERQEEIPDVSVLPKIHISEVSRFTDRVPIRHSTITAHQSKLDPKIHTSTPTAPVQWADQPTAGISYVRASLAISQCPPHLLPYVPLFSNTLASVGAGPYDYMQLSQEMELSTGAFNVGRSTRGDPIKPGHYSLRLGLYSGSLNRNLDRTMDLWEHILTSPRFQDKARLKTLIGNMVHSMQSSMVDSGHSFASTLGSAKLTGRGKIEEIWSGVSQFNFIKGLHEMEDLSTVSDRLQELSTFILDPSRVSFAVNAEASSFEKVDSRLSTVLSRFRSANHGAAHSLPHERLLADDPLNDLANDPRHIYFGLQSQVHYVTRTFRSVPYTDPDYTKLDLLSLVMAPNFLHKEIREKGGAYGSGLSNGGGTLSFYSYRDPNVLETLSAFNRGIEWINNGEFTEEHLEEAKLQLFSTLDAPVAPSKKGLRFFQSEITDEMAQTRRDRIFAVTRDDIVDVCKRFLTNDKPSAVAVFGSDQTTEFKEHPEWHYREQ